MSEITSIFLRTYVGGYMASEAAAPQAGDASGRALAEGYVVAVPGSRGRNSKVGETWTGRAPAAILDLKATNAPHWYVRHGSRDRDTSFPVPVAFATKLENAGLDVDFLLAWNRPHSGDYALDEVFDWIRQITSR